MTIPLSDWELWDRTVLLAVNQANHPWLDQAMIVITSRLAWVPVYALWIYWLWRVYGKQVWRVLLVLTLLVVGTDQSSNALKNGWGRLRPCHEPTVAPALHLPDGCGGKYGTVSSHATNTMGVACLLGWLSLLPAHRARWPRFWGCSLILYVVLVALSRVYLGAHYPTDILRGWLLGLAWAGIAGLAWVFWERRRLNR